MQTIVTHSGSFDPDDVLAVATVSMYLGKDNFEIVRSRDTEVIEKGDWVVDVGGKYDPENKRFDHHQNGVPKRENKVPYSAFGLVWKEIGPEVCGSKSVANSLEEKFVYPIDAADNNMQVCCSCDNGINSYEFFDVIDAFKPVWGTEEDYYTGFMRAVSFARKLLRRQIAQQHGEEKMMEYARKVLENSENKGLLVFEKPMIRHKLANFEEVKVFISPVFAAESENWMAVTVPNGSQSFDNRAKFPESWSGKYGEDLIKEAGIDNLVFSHKERYIVVTKDKETALKVANMAE